MLEILQSLALSETMRPDAKISAKMNMLIKNVIKADVDAEYVINYASWLAPKVGLDANKLAAQK